jgi:hypothetical protein
VTAEAENYDGWYLVEVMGHRRLAGYVREVTLAGAGMLRIDVPSEPPTTQFIPPASLYALTPIDEALARTLAVRYKPEPVSRYELAALMPGKPIEAAAYSTDGDDDGEGDPSPKGDDDDLPY